MAEPSRTPSTTQHPRLQAHVLIVEARFYDAIMDQLLQGATEALEAAGVSYDVVTVPGALEIPGAVAIAYDAAGPAYDAVVALGCIIRGETYHFEIVANESARGLTDFGMAHAFPIGNAILTVETEEQAVVRADPARGNKGGEAAEAALALLRLKRLMGTR
ncbi:6,7-dimethyl-8-ribityllumazine synthase [Lichenifustis flavocetrariae]|uniref:6,7-dimethyl-8-ribityllumazine synthase n=1 Tax=Lichenifustis flavocetrariae TaxID=2949735 RepID=A0AA42CN79_9HYPH|nr:6,7-dimethyl-8-ribityllumazine synthase [Lichenifustis flavocetrariae]MCW6509137.1 6,7-dimethyl-8-ribityllumazine synthase [Lichenifustis flavocetrariae]